MIIDEQFRTLIPPLTDDEFKRLEENILKEGIRDKLVVWDNTLIDGHNRYRIATEHGLTYETIQKDFGSREHALNWIISNQLGRRNLNPNQIAYLRGKRYEMEKKIWGGDRKSDEFEKSSSQSGNLIPDPAKTNENLAKEYGVGKSTISRNSIYARAVDTLPDEVKQSVLSGSDTVSHESANTILKFDTPTQKKFLKEVESGTPIKEAVKKVTPDEKREQEDNILRAEMERQRVMRDRAKFDKYIIRTTDVTVCNKALFLENSGDISDNVEIWVIPNSEKAREAKEILRDSLNFKFG